MPESVEIPAPVKATSEDDSLMSRTAKSMGSITSPYCGYIKRFVTAMVDLQRHSSPVIILNLSGKTETISCEESSFPKRGDFDSQKLLMVLPIKDIKKEKEVSS